MRFRPCIDIHNGRVKQIVGDSLKDEGNQAEANFISEQDAGFYGRLYKNDGLRGGHIILLNPEGSAYYEADVVQAFRALRAFYGGLQIGGGIHERNAERFLIAGASHVIVTSYVFQNGKIQFSNLKRIASVVGKDHLVLDLSCRKREDDYYIVTDRWQKFTEIRVEQELLEELSSYCDEFLIHAVDVEGKAAGIELPLVKLLGSWAGIPITYAGGVASMEDINKLRAYGKNRLNVTVGSALDLFGGKLPYKELIKLR